MIDCQALVPIPVPPNPKTKPKAVPNQKVQLGLGLTLESHGPIPFFVTNETLTLKPYDNDPI